MSTFIDAIGKTLLNLCQELENSAAPVVNELCQAAGLCQASSSNQRRELLHRETELLKFIEARPKPMPVGCYFRMEIVRVPHPSSAVENALEKLKAKL